MSFLIGLVADLGEWLLTKLFSVLSLDYQQWKAKRVADAALAANQTNLQNAEASGNEQAIINAGQSSLNNDGGN
jgi:hypothetical protein